MDKSGGNLSTEQKILDAARKIFFKKGLYGARMQEIADEAGINKALLHYYFRNKDKLFQAIFKNTLHSFFPLILQIFNSEDPIEKKVHLLVSQYMDFLSANPYLPLFLINEINRDPGGEMPLKQILVEMGEIKSSRFIKQFEENIRKGAFIPVKPEQFLINLFALILFPFINKTMLTIAFSMDEHEFSNLISERKTLIPEMVLRSISNSSQEKYYKNEQ